MANDFKTSKKQNQYLAINISSKSNAHRLPWYQVVMVSGCHGIRLSWCQVVRVCCTSSEDVKVE